MVHEAVAVGGWNYWNAFFLYFAAAFAPIGSWIYFILEGQYHMTANDMPRPLGLWIAYRIIALSVEAVVATWLVPVVMPRGNEWALAIAGAIFAQSAYYTSKARRQFRDWIAESRDSSGNK